MKQDRHHQDMEEMLRARTPIRSQPKDDLLLSGPREVSHAPTHSAKPEPLIAGSGQARDAVKLVGGNDSKADLETFFNSPPIQQLKLQICDIGRRMWQRAYVDGNGGNIAVRVGPDLALCTPTGVSKGFMQPEDLCLVDLAGHQLAGVKQRTSEILMHLQIMQRQPRAVASVHGHPPYSTAFAVAGIQPPAGMVSEFELCVSVAVAPYRTPGTPELGQLIAELADQHNTILMANHGVVAWSHNHVEDAYFKLEIIETYCRTVLIASQLGKPLNALTSDQIQELLQIKQSLGIPDPRLGHTHSQSGGRLEPPSDSSASEPPSTAPAEHLPRIPAADLERLAQAVKDQLAGRLK